VIGYSKPKRVTANAYNFAFTSALLYPLQLSHPLCQLYKIYWDIISLGAGKSPSIDLPAPEKEKNEKEKSDLLYQQMGVKQTSYYG